MSARQTSNTAGAAKPGKESSRREAILAAAASIFAEKGVHATTTREIGERASMLSGSLYYHFPSKEAIALEVVARYLTELLEAYERVLADTTTPAEKLAALFRVSLELSDARPHEVMILFQDWPALTAVDDSLDATMVRVEEIWCGVIEAGIRDGQLRADLDARLAYRTIMGAIAWVPRWYRSGGRRTIREIAELQAEMLLRGMLGTRDATAP